MLRTVSLWLLAAVLLWPGTGWAKIKKDLTYSYSAVWTTTIRLLRADRGYKITDKDRESGYVLFVYPGNGSVKECHAALEIVRARDENGYSVVRVMLEIAHQPSYIALDLLDRLERKLTEERGEAPPRRRDPPPKPDPPENKKKGDTESG